MIEAFQRTTLFALYQFAVVLGIVLMPLALVARQVGVTLPVGRFIDTVGEAYENANPR